MLFFCFSSKDRDSVVESILYHVSNYAIPVWYDRQQMLLGDQRNYKNFIEGVDHSRYAIIILSHNAISSVCAREEIELIEKKYEKGEIIVFPIFYKLKANEIPAEFAWMSQLVYKELDETIDSLSACNHIICRILLDEVTKYKINSLDSFLAQYQNIPVYAYLVQLIKSYNTINGDNKNARITLLFAGCEYIRCHYNLNGIPRYYHEGIDFLFSQTKLHLSIDLREILIFERLFLLLLNSSIFGYFV